MFEIFIDSDDDYLAVVSIQDESCPMYASARSSLCLSLPLSLLPSLCRCRCRCRCSCLFNPLLSLSLAVSPSLSLSLSPITSQLYQSKMNLAHCTYHWNKRGLTFTASLLYLLSSLPPSPIPHFPRFWAFFLYRHDLPENVKFSGDNQVVSRLGTMRVSRKWLGNNATGAYLVFVMIPRTVDGIKRNTTDCPVSTVQYTAIPPAFNSLSRASNTSTFFF